jgi:hypothetical protein
MKLNASALRLEALIILQVLGTRAIDMVASVM